VPQLAAALKDPTLPVRLAATQLVVLLALLAVELGAGALVTELIQRALVEPGERVARI
jgi:hypothetical protein